jgi:hypothetical protein
MNLRSLAIVLVLGLGALPAAAQSRLLDEPDYGDEIGLELVQDSGAQIAPSEAAAIAQDTMPGAKVLKVKLLSSGVYAVTLKVQGSVVKVMVSAEDGSIQ